MRAVSAPEVRLHLICAAVQVGPLELTHICKIAWSCGFLLDVVNNYAFNFVKGFAGSMESAFDVEPFHSLRTFARSDFVNSQPATTLCLALGRLSIVNDSRIGTDFGRRQMRNGLI